MYRSFLINLLFAPSSEEGGRKQTSLNHAATSGLKEYFGGVTRLKWLFLTFNYLPEELKSVILMGMSTTFSSRT